MKISALALVVALSACGGCASSPQPYKGVRIRPAVLQQLADVHDEFERETAWCLTGSTKGGVVTVDDLAAPTVADRTPVSATFSCGAWTSAIGYAHNHPNTPAAYCFPSATDIQSLDRMRFDVLLISCDGGVFVYRFRGEAELYRIGPDRYGRPTVSSLPR